MLVISTIFLHLLLFILKKIKFDFGVDVNFRLFVFFELFLLTFFMIKSFFYIKKNKLNVSLSNNFVFNSYLFKLFNNKTTRYILIPSTLFTLAIFFSLASNYGFHMFLSYLSPFFLYVFFFIFEKKIKNDKSLIFFLFIFYLIFDTQENSFLKKVSLILLSTIIATVFVKEIKKLLVSRKNF